ncbi:MAG TPA: hypothetical protein VHB79_10385 [Polyangiaceae bacterium]|nr:hypothetical protein [Polyangiaceae bacterium]
MRLEYSIATVGEKQLFSVFRGIEKEAAASNRRIANDSQRSAARVARQTTGPLLGPGRKEQAAQLRANERAAIASARAEIRARLAGEKELARAKESLDKQRSRGLMAAFNAQQREERRALAAQRSTRERMARGVLTGAGRGIKNTLTMGGAALGVAGGFAIAGALSEQADIRRRASVLANKAGNPALKGELASEATGVRGFTGSEALGALDAFVGKTGDLAAGRASLKELGDLALATDANFNELGEAAGNAFNVIADTVKDPKKRVEELQKVMRGWAGQGNIGAIELSDMATFGGRLGGATRKFAGNPSDLLLSMGAMSQAAVRAGGASDAAEATTGVARFAADLTKRPAQKALAGLGVNIFADKGKTKIKDPAQVIADILDKTKGNLALGEDVMNAESGKVLSGFSSIYLDAEKSKKGTGKAAVLGEFQRYKAAGLTKTGVDTQANSRMEEPDKQFSEAMKAFNTAVGKDLLPAVTKLVPKFTELVPTIGELASKAAAFVGWFSENPATGLGALLAANVAAEVAAAGIGSLVATGVSRGVTALATASTNFVSSLSTAQIGAAKFAGASMLAAAAVYAAYDQNETLKKYTGGLGIGDLTTGLLSGKGIMEQINEKQDAEAREDARKRSLQAPGNVPLVGKAPGATAAVSPGETKTIPGQPASAPTTGNAAAAKMDAAVDKFSAAVAKIPTGSGSGGNNDPKRTLPIVAPSRT